MNSPNVQNILDSLDSLIEKYNNVIQNIEVQANDPLNERAYGGIVRAEKGMLVESIAKKLVSTAWIDVLEQRSERLKIKKNKINIPMRTAYIDRITRAEVQSHLRNNLSEQYYKFRTDIQVYIDDTLVLPIECKAYTENAMLKRIVFDANLAYEHMNIHKFILFQLESQLTGDYSELNDITYGSPPSNTILSYCNVNIDIITLLTGERKVKKPIHNPRFFKPLELRSLEKALLRISDSLREFI
jgi:hypothetical protein